MFTQPRPNLLESDEGFSVEIVSRGGLRYCEGSKCAQIDGEMAAPPTGWIVYTDSITHWESPNGVEQVSNDEFSAIVENVRRAFRHWGFEIDVL